MDLQKTGALIAAARKEKGLTQQQLAKRLHISHTTVSKWERGLGFPEVSLLEPLAQALDLTLTDLFRGEKGAVANVEETVNQAVRAAREELLERQRDTRSYVIALLVCILIIVSLSLWGIIRVKNTPHEEDIRGTYQSNSIQIGQGAFQWEGGYLIQLAAQNWDEEQSFSLYINSCLVDSGSWVKLKPNLYCLKGAYCELTVELHKDGSFYLQLPGLEEVILMNKLNDVPMYNGNQDLWSSQQEKYRELITAE